MSPLCLCKCQPLTVNSRHPSPPSVTQKMPQSTQTSSLHPSPAPYSSLWILLLLLFTHIPRMSSTPTALATLRQLEATLQLVVTLSSHFTITEIVEICRILAQAHSTIKAILEEGSLAAEGVTHVCKFGTHFLDPYSIYFNEDNGNDRAQSLTRGSTSRGVGQRHYNTARGTTSRRPFIRQSVSDRAAGRVTQGQAPIVIIDLNDEERSNGMPTPPVRVYLLLISCLEA